MFVLFAAYLFPLRSSVPILIRDQCSGMSPVNPQEPNKMLFILVLLVNEGNTPIHIHMHTKAHKEQNNGNNNMNREWNEEHAHFHLHTLSMCVCVHGGVCCVALLLCVCLYRLGGGLKYLSSMGITTLDISSNQFKNDPSVSRVHTHIHTRTHSHPLTHLCTHTHTHTHTCAIRRPEH